MPHVIFTDHGLLRCKQQKINPQVVTMAILASVPPAAGEFKWYFPEARFSVVCDYYPLLERYIVITVVGSHKLSLRKHRWNRG